MRRFYQKDQRKNTFRHWAEVRKILEQDRLCDSLKGRVRYFATRYRGAHDQTGRVCVLVDGKEIINMPFETEIKIYAEVNRRWPGSGKSRGQLEPEVRKDFGEQGLYEAGDFKYALEEFLASDISLSLQSEILLVRMLAILDRRVGKRTLLKIKPAVDQLPEWLQFFYRLRLESENLWE
ncbi:MAG: hypothetical protein LBB75_02990 [Oscillospiraceae bacterium]|jgi:hypothetical protein|nr:hypothetical protein [Oscillospiraceae bacterium]